MCAVDVRVNFRHKSTDKRFWPNFGAFCWMRLQTSFFSFAGSALFARASTQKRKYAAEGFSFYFCGGWLFHNPWDGLESKQFFDFISTVLLKNPSLEGGATRSACATLMHTPSSDGDGFDLKCALGFVGSMVKQSNFPFVTFSVLPLGSEGFMERWQWMMRGAKGEISIPSHSMSSFFILHFLKATAAPANFNHQRRG